MSTRQETPGPGHNDAEQRAEIIREAIGELLAIDEDRVASNAKYKKRRDNAVARFKEMGLLMADLNPALRIAKLKDQAENAEKQEDRERAARALQVSIATYVEAVAAVKEETGQMDFDEILEEGREARKAQKKAPEAKVGKVKGAKAGDQPAAH